MATKETTKQTRDRLYEEAKKKKAKSAGTAKDERPSSQARTASNGNGGTTRRRPVEYFSGSAFDASTKRALKKSGVD